MSIGILENMDKSFATGNATKTDIST